MAVFGVAFGLKRRGGNRSSILFWNNWIYLMFDFFADPQIWALHVRLLRSLQTRCVNNVGINRTMLYSTECLITIFTIPF